MLHLKSQDPMDTGLLSFECRHYHYLGIPNPNQVQGFQWMCPLLCGSHRVAMSQLLALALLRHQGHNLHHRQIHRHRNHSIVMGGVGRHLVDRNWKRYLPIHRHPYLTTGLQFQGMHRLFAL